MLIAAEEAGIVLDGVFKQQLAPENLNVVELLCFQLHIDKSGGRAFEEIVMQALNCIITIV